MLLVWRLGLASWGFGFRVDILLVWGFCSRNSDLPEEVSGSKCFDWSVLATAWLAIWGLGFRGFYTGSV